MIVLLGVNDLGHPGTIAPESERVTPADLIAGSQQVIDRAHQQGMLVFGGTITPFATDTFGFDTPVNRSARLVVNRWIRTSGAYDGVVDFDAAVGDPADPDRIRPDSTGRPPAPELRGAALVNAVPLRLSAEHDRSAAGLAVRRRPCMIGVPSPSGG